jgi:6-phosphogluconolactonase
LEPRASVLGDERCVPPSDPASNYRLAKDWLIQGARIPERNVHRIAGEIAPKEAAHLYAEQIRRFFSREPDEMPRFDVVQCGMGAAAHTASLFPGEPLLDDRAGIAAAVFAPQSRQWRVTLLPGPLLAARHVVYLGREPTRPKPCGPCFKRARTEKVSLPTDRPGGGVVFG